MWAILSNFLFIFLLLDGGQRTNGAPSADWSDRYLDKEVKTQHKSYHKLTSDNINLALFSVCCRAIQLTPELLERKQWYLTTDDKQKKLRDHQFTASATEEYV